jgi:hypothetical protein
LLIALPRTKARINHHLLHHEDGIHYFGFMPGRSLGRWLSSTKQ